MPDIASELGANWHAIDDAVMAYPTALLDADHNRNCAVEAPDEELTEVVVNWGLLWEEVAMDEREQQRKMRHRLGVLRHAEEVSGSVAATCRYYGISRRCFYKWKHRLAESTGGRTGPVTIRALRSQEQRHGRDPHTRAEAARLSTSRARVAAC